MVNTTCPKCNNNLVDDIVNKYLFCNKCSIYYKQNKQGTLYQLKWRGPNIVKKKDRVSLFILSLIILFYGAYGLIRNDIYIRGKRGPGIHYHNIPAIIVFTSIVFSALYLISIIVDHYDKRNNENKYKAFKKVSIVIAIICFILASILQSCVDIGMFVL
jgi:hypothetical protein